MTVSGAQLGDLMRHGRQILVHRLQALLGKSCEATTSI